MAAMRVWLDEHRVEPSSFACHDSEYGVLVSLEFKIAHQADQFARHFGGRAEGQVPPEPAKPPAAEVLETGLWPSSRNRVTRPLF